MTTNEAALHKALLALYRVTELNDETQAAYEAAEAVLEVYSTPVPEAATSGFDLDKATELERGLYHLCQELERLPASPLMTRLTLAMSTAMIELWRLRTRETACIGRDPLCPCQDGDACHYRDTATTKAMPIPMPPIEVGDVVISKLGNRWSVTAVDGHLMLLHNVPPEAPGARGTTRSGPMPEWAAAIERNGVVIWTRTETPS